MGKIWIGTNVIKEDEPCLGLYEMNLQSPGNRGWRRYQIIVVMRNNQPVEFRQDMGLAKKFKVSQFRIPGGARDEITGNFYIEHTVGELRDIADQMRAIPLFDRVELTKRELAQIY